MGIPPGGATLERPYLPTVRPRQLGSAGGGPSASSGRGRRFPPPWIEVGGCRCRRCVDAPARRVGFWVILPDGSRPQAAIRAGDRGSDAETGAAGAHASTV